jgi:hypothetical protein
MAQKYRFEFFLLRYAPNALSDEFMNIGIVLFDPAALLTGFFAARFIVDWERLQTFDDDAGIELLRATVADIERKLRNPASREYLLQLMEDSFSNAIRLSPRQACITEDPVSEVESLARRHLLPTVDAAQHLTFRA